MKRLTCTPFSGRMEKACLTTAQSDGIRLEPCGKWAVFDNLRTARAAFGVTDRDLAVLWALLSFLPGADLDQDAGLVVFPSNAALSDRSHGMAESTLRRHLAALVAAGLVLRHDSPNGKRYARRGAGGVIELAFGFDLSPLLARADEIAAQASAVRDAAEALSRAREAASLHLRDARNLLAWAKEGTACYRELAPLAETLARLSARLRRRMAKPDAEALAAQAAKLVDAVSALIESTETDGNAARDGRHHTESKSGLTDSDPCQENERKNVSDLAETGPEMGPEMGLKPGQVPLYLVVKACPEIGLYAGAPVRRWEELVRAARQVRPMMGISRDAWDDARGVMGEPQAAMVVAAILQRSGGIRSPGGYLRSLTRRAAQGRFRPSGMILSLLSGG